MITIARTQNKLIMKNMQLCFSLNGAYYFFGHNADTAIGQARNTPVDFSLLLFIFCSYRRKKQVS